MAACYYEKDLLAIEYENKRLHRSLIKFWNVNYIDPKAEEMAKEAALVAEAAEQEELDKQSAADEELRLAQEIFERLEREKAADEAEKQAEIAAAMAEANGEVEVTDSDYNATTGSYSGAYGKGPVDDSTLDQAAAILKERENAMQSLFDGVSINF